MEVSLRTEQQPYRIPYVEGDNELRKTHGRLRRACEERCKLWRPHGDGEGPLRY